jgi:hypothetical protein
MKSDKYHDPESEHLSFLKNGFVNWKRSLDPIETEFSPKGWSSLHTDYPRQTDGFNCGIYVMLILEILMDESFDERAEVTFLNTPAALIQRRKDIYSALENNRC